MSRPLWRRVAELEHRAHPVLFACAGDPDNPKKGPNKSVAAHRAGGLHDHHLSKFGPALSFPAQLCPCSTSAALALLETTGDAPQSPLKEAPTILFTPKKEVVTSGVLGGAIDCGRIHICVAHTSCKWLIARHNITRRQWRRVMTKARLE